MRTIEISTFADFLTHGPSQIISPVNGTVVRTMTQREDACHVLCGDGSEASVPLETAVTYQPWVMDRGSMLFELGGQQLKICTEFDLLRTERGEEFLIVPANVRLAC